MALAIIPARFGSTRFPGKPLADDTGKPLIRHVVEAAQAMACLSRVVVATDDERIAAAVRGFGAEVVMTREDHPNGSSRIAEAADALRLSDDELIVNVQGDEPEVQPAVIESLLTALRNDPEAPMATLASPFAEGEDPASPHVVKVVVGTNRRALYFSRSLIPYARNRGTAGAGPLKHPGLYAYRRPFLRTYVSLSPTPLEEAESLEQLRVLEHGYAMAVGLVTVRHTGIDTPEQYAAFVARQRG